jgi:hypothetical protein
LPHSHIFRAPLNFLASLIAITVFCWACVFLLAARADNPPTTEIVGAIEGEAISVEGPMSVEAAHGVVRTILRSGSNVHVKSGQARVELVEGGQIVVCGPAHFSVLKSGKSLTIALDSGTIHAHIENEPTLSVFTPQIQANPISIGNGAQDIVVGVESTGNMCIRANRGAVRIEQQLTGQSVLVPQNGDISLANGQLETMNNTIGRCECEMVKAVKPSSTTTEVSQLATPEVVQKRASEKKTAPNPELPPRMAPQEPIYQVFMPPLQYDASKKVQADYDPNLVVLVRRVRLRPTLILQGRVEGNPVVAQNTKPVAETARPGASNKPSEDTTWNRVRTFFHKLWSPTS